MTRSLTIWYMYMRSWGIGLRQDLKKSTNQSVVGKNIAHRTFSFAWFLSGFLCYRTCVLQDFCQSSENPLARDPISPAGVPSLPSPLPGFRMSLFFLMLALGQKFSRASGQHVQGFVLRSTGFPFRNPASGTRILPVRNCGFLLWQQQ